MRCKFIWEGIGKIGVLIVRLNSLVNFCISYCQHIQAILIMEPIYRPNLGICMTNNLYLPCG